MSRCTTTDRATTNVLTGSSVLAIKVVSKIPSRHPRNWSCDEARIKEKAGKCINLKWNQTTIKEKTTKKAQNNKRHSTIEETDETRPFFRDRPPTYTKSSLTVHNYSTHILSPQELHVLQKGLSFAPTPQTPPFKLHIYLLQQYDKFCKSLRLASRKNSDHTSSNLACLTKEVNHPNNIYRKMKFLPRPIIFESTVTRYSGIPRLENYIFHTKDILDEALPEICTQKKTNLTPQQVKTVCKLQRTRSLITIKPADKNLWVVLLDTDDYIMQCCNILKDENTQKNTHSQKS